MDTKDFLEQIFADWKQEYGPAGVTRHIDSHIEKSNIDMLVLHNVSKELFVNLHQFFKDR